MLIQDISTRDWIQIASTGISILAPIVSAGVIKALSSSFATRKELDGFGSRVEKEERHSAMYLENCKNMTFRIDTLENRANEGDNLQGQLMKNYEIQRGEISRNRDERIDKFHELDKRILLLEHYTNNNREK